MNEALQADAEAEEISDLIPSTEPLTPPVATPTGPPYKSTYCLNRSCSGEILSWMVDKHLGVLIQKRKDGIQYFHLMSLGYRRLPRWDLCHLARLKMVNRHNVGWADYIEETLKNEAYYDKWRIFIPAKGKVVKSKRRKHPITKRPWVRTEYPPAQYLVRIPLHRYPSRFLRDAGWWAYDPTLRRSSTHCMVMYL